MSKWPASWRIIVISILCCFASGCLPMSDTPVDDEKDPNFIEGRNHYNMMDWKGAVEAYERTVQANPRNAAAHFELGVLYQDKLNDPVYAAFHYKKYLELRPKSSYSETVNAGLARCRMDIAKTVNYVVVSGEVHADLKRLTNELAVAKQHIDALQRQLAAQPRVVTQWLKFSVTNYFTNYVQVAARQTTNVVPQARPATNSSPRNTVVPPANTTTARRAAITTPVTRADIRPPAAKNRTYTVRSGETMAEVARRYGVSLPKLQAANPTIQPRPLKPGQTLNIPLQ